MNISHKRFSFLLSVFCLVEFKGFARDHAHHVMSHVNDFCCSHSCFEKLADEMWMKLITEFKQMLDDMERKEWKDFIK